MSRRLVIGTGMMVAWAAASHLTGAYPQQPTFRTRIDVVSVNVSVMKGREPMTGLGAADFELTDNGVRQTVDAVSLEHVPIDVTLVLTGYSPDRASEHGRGLVSAEATRQLLLPADRLRVVWVNGDVRGGLVGADYTVQTDPTIVTARAAGMATTDVSVSPDGQVLGKVGFGIALADGLFYALAWPVDADRRHLVVAFTDGWDTVSTLEMDTLPKLAAHSDAVLHAVFWATPGGGSGSAGGLEFGGAGPPTSASFRAWEASYRVVDEAVQRTGGTLQRSDHAPEALASIIADFRSSYVLRYTPRDVVPGGWHELQVKVTRPESFKIRARKGYEGG